jgi:hypothetical protein
VNGEKAKLRMTTPETRRLRLGTIAILVIGFGCSIWIYLTAQPPPGNPLGYEPEDTKKYVRDMEVYGGKANLLAGELRQWFDSLWHGRRLALTVAVITVIAAGVFVFVTVPLPSEVEAGAAGGKDRVRAPDR